MAAATWLALFLTLRAAPLAGEGVPPPQTPQENLERGEMPALAAAETLARRLVEAIAAGDPAAVADGFFPERAFDVLKDGPRPREYHRKLVGWYVDDLRREHERVKSRGALTYDGFARGGCVWRAPGTEGNRIAYWSCYRNRFFARAASGERVEFELRAMINWGPDWYVTHLGPIP